MATYTVKGTIKDQKGQPQQGIIIRATDKDFTGENALGSPDSTDASGAYSIVYNSDDFVIEGKETTVADLIVRAFDSTGQLLAKSEMLRGSEQTKEEQQSQKPVVIDLVIGTDSDAEDGAIVRGRITVGDVPTKDIAVMAFDKDLPSKNSDEALGSCKTDALGNYYIPYSPKNAQKAERGTADVYIKVEKSENMEHPDTIGTEGGKSDTRYNVGREVVIDLALTAIETIGKTIEFDNYLAIISPITEGIAITDFQPEDIDFLTNETGINAAHLEYLRLADLWATNHKKYR